MSKTISEQQPKSDPAAKPAAPGAHEPAGGAPRDDRQATETAAGRHEGANPPQHKTE